VHTFFLAKKEVFLDGHLVGQDCQISILQTEAFIVLTSCGLGQGKEVQLKQKKHNFSSLPLLKYHLKTQKCPISSPETQMSLL